MMEEGDGLGDDEAMGGDEQVFMSKDAMAQRDAAANANAEQSSAVEMDASRCFLSVPELQATMWTHSECLMHFVSVAALLEDADKWLEMCGLLDTNDMHASRSSLLYALQFVLQRLNDSFDA